MIPLPFSLDKAIAIGASVVALIGVALLAYMIRESGKEAQWRKDEPVIERLRRDVADCKATLSQQSVALEAQNRAIEQLGLEAMERQKIADAAIRKARQETNMYRLRAERIAKARPGPDVCAAARSLIVDTLGEER